MKILIYFTDTLANKVRSRIIPITLLLAAVASNGRAEIIPSSRLPLANTWENAGVAGGIPARETIFADVTDTPYNADNTGVVDADAAIQAALDACPDGQTVYVPAGTYKVLGSLKVPSNVTLRGAGQDVTTLNLHRRMSMTPGGLRFPQPHVADAFPVTGGTAAGSTTINVSDTTNAAAGRLLYIVNGDDYPTVWRNATSDNGNRVGSMHRITSVVANTSVTFTPGLPVDYDINPKCGFQSKSAHYRAGIESMTLDGTNVSTTSSTGIITFDSAWDCWIYDVKFQDVPDKTIVASYSGRLEIRKCYLTEPRNGGSNLEALDFGTSISFSKIVDNICYKAGFPSIVLGDGGSYGCIGNVIAYNYVDESFFYRPGEHDAEPFIMSADISLAHGGHNKFNLVEGNYCGKINADSWHYGGSDNTIFRNAVTGQHDWSNQHKECAIVIDRRQTNYNIVGNVLGLADDDADNDYVTAVRWNGTAIYQLGFPNIGNTNWVYEYPSTQNPLQHGANNAKDEYVYRNNTTYGTTIIEGNWDSHTNEQDWTITPEALPDSLYLSGKPSWFGNLNWPPVDPSNPITGDPTIIPAGYRFINGNQGYIISGPKPVAPGNLQTAQSQ